jgi:DNA adenine methylase
MAKPFIKWVGGKWKLRDELTSRLPAGVSERRHVEPFVGGGAFFFSRMKSDVVEAPAKAMLCDTNARLIHAYESVRNDVEGVIAALELLCTGHSKEFFYRVRKEFNHGSSRGSEQAARFIYLNKTCFNGLYRENQNGDFNSPFGKYKNPAILDTENLYAVSAALKGATLHVASFEESVGLCGPEDFIYLDPPYDPVSKTASFTGYEMNGFSDRDQRWLAQTCKRLDEMGAQWLLSNSDTEFVRGLYSDFTVDTIQAGRSVNRDGQGRGKVNEILAYNYPLQTT